MDGGIHFTVRTRNCPFSKLLQLASVLYTAAPLGHGVSSLQWILGPPVHSHQWNHHLMHLQSTSANYILPASSINDGFFLVNYHSIWNESRRFQEFKFRKSVLFLEFLREVMPLLLDLPTRLCFLNCFVCSPAISLRFLVFSFGCILKFLMKFEAKPWADLSKRWLPKSHGDVSSMFYLLTYL